MREKERKLGKYSDQFIILGVAAAAAGFIYVVHADDVARCFSLPPPSPRDRELHFACVTYVRARG